jgi:hypothetical protein
MPKEYDPTTNKLVKGCFWPFAVFESVEKLANSMAALCRLAVVRHRYFSAMLMAADGHEQTFSQRPSNCATAKLIYKKRAPNGARIN